MLINTSIYLYYLLIGDAKVVYVKWIYMVILKNLYQIHKHTHTHTHTYIYIYINNLLRATD